MVKLFKKKSSQKTKTFKFETSLKLKDLPLEEFAHVTYAFQVAILRFERMLKESLLEGYVTSTTLERICREMKIAEIRTIKIPETPSVAAIFGSDAPEIKAKEVVPVSQAPTVPSTPISQPIVSTVSTPTPTPVSAPIPSLDTPPSQPSPIEKPTPKPKISFSIPEISPPSIAPTITPTPSSSEPQTPPPLIPKISFPSLSKPSTTTPSNLLSQTLGKREEDRATGIAILRKQMLTELKKIRSVVSEDQR